MSTATDTNPTITNTVAAFDDVQTFTAGGGK
jgi:hypothetical protein